MKKTLPTPVLLLVFKGLAILCISLLSNPVCSQPPILSQTYGVGARIQTSGIGADLFYARTIDTRWAWTLSSSLVSLKAPREVRIESLYGDQGGNAYVFDKINYAYMLNALYGREYTVSPLSGFNRLTLTLGMSAGPSLAILKPIYYEIVRQSSNNAPILVTETYNFGPDPQADFVSIYGEANFFDGFSEMRYVPGVCFEFHARMNLSGDFLNLKAVQSGFRVDAFTSRLNILDREDDQRIFFNLFVGLMIGNSW